MLTSAPLLETVSSLAGHYQNALNQYNLSKAHRALLQETHTALLKFHQAISVISDPAKCENLLINYAPTFQHLDEWFASTASQKHKHLRELVSGVDVLAIVLLCFEEEERSENRELPVFS